LCITLQGRKLQRGAAGKAGGKSGGDDKKSTESEPSKAVSAEGGKGQGTAGDNASDALFAGLADNKMLQ